MKPVFALSPSVRVLSLSFNRRITNSYSMQKIAGSSLSDRAVEVAAGAAVFGGSQYIIGYAANGGHNARRRICSTRRRFLPNDAPPSSDLSI